MSTMRAAVLKDGAFAVAELGMPTPGPGEVLVKVLACGICGSDLHLFKHQRSIIDKARAMGADVADLERGVTEGLVLGHEFVGEIMAFGPGAGEALAIGDRVVSVPFVLREGAPVLIGSVPETSGAYAEYMVLTEALLLKVDHDVPTEAAAFVEPLGIAVHAFARSGMTADDTAVIIGAGPIGLAIAAVCRAKGVKDIIVAELSPKRRELARAMGATHVVDAAKDSALLKAAEVTPGSQVHIFENTGAPGMIGRLVLEAPQKAVITVTGIASDEESFIPMIAITKELVMHFVIYYEPGEFAEALTMIRNGEFDWQALHTGTVGLGGIPAAFQDLADPETHAKILIDPWKEDPS